MKKNGENSRRHLFKRQSSQQTKRFKQKKAQSISPLPKQINLHQNKQNAHPNLNYKGESIYEKPKHTYYELKNSNINKELNKYKNYVPSAYIQPTQKPKEINVVMSKSLEKCQLYHEKQTPKSSYLILNKNEEILCCDECSKKYPHKTHIRKITEKQIAGKKIGEYFKDLYQNLNMMELLKENTLKYRQKYREYAYKEERKHQKYYHQILEVIEENMKTSQTILRKKINQVDRVFDDKIQLFDQEIQKIQRMMNQITNSQDEFFYEFKQLTRLSSIKKDDYTLYLPFLSLSINESLLQEFKINFDSQYSIKIVTEKQVPKEQKQSEKAKKEFSDDYYHKSSNYRNECQSRSKSYQIPNSYNSYDDTQLYCDEALGPSISSVNNFSFEGEQDNIVPIIELTEEEEVISPNFKIF